MAPSSAKCCCGLCACAPDSRTLSILLISVGGVSQIRTYQIVDSQLSNCWCWMLLANSLNVATKVDCWGRFWAISNYFEQNTSELEQKLSIFGEILSKISDIWAMLQQFWAFSSVFGLKYWTGEYEMLNVDSWASKCCNICWTLLRSPNVAPSSWTIW